MNSRECKQPADRSMDCSTNNFPEINAIHRLWDRACINPTIKYREDFSALPPLYLFYLPPFCFFFLFFFLTHTSHRGFTERGNSIETWKSKCYVKVDQSPLLQKKRRFCECLSNVQNADELENTIQRLFYVKSYLSFELHYSWKKFDVSLLERRNLMLPRRNTFVN